MKKYLIILLLLLTAEFLYAYNSAAVPSYIARYKDIALRHEKEYGIPATITLAQGILESGAGQSGLTRSSNNHFGIKAFGWKGKVHRAWDDETQKSRFRCYSSAADSYRDHALLLTSNSRYRFLFQISIYDYRGWAHGLKKAGYATAPDYADGLIGLIEKYRLYEINGGVKLKPGKPVTITKYETIETPIYEEEWIVEEEEESEEEIALAAASSRYAVLINDVHCTVLQPGEDLSFVARNYDIPVGDLLKFNELSSENRVKAGDIIYLTKKKKKYYGAQDVYVTKSGDTLYAVSQEFGIQLPYLAKLNNMNEYERLKEGTRIKLK